MFERNYKLRELIKIVHDENLSNVRFVIKYLKLFKYKICDKIFETLKLFLPKKTVTKCNICK